MLNIKKSLPLMAVIIGVCSAFATKQHHSFKSVKRFDDPVYFQFTGSPGSESTVSNWQEISSSAYAGLGCDGEMHGPKRDSKSIH